MKTRVIALVLAAIMVLGGCSSVSAPEQERYEATFMTLFDTVTKIVGYAESEEGRFRRQLRKFMTSCWNTISFTIFIRIMMESIISKRSMTAPAANR